MSPLEVAEQLGVSDQTVYNWIREKRIASLRNHAITGTNVVGVASAFGELASAAGAIADAVEAEDQAADAGELRRRAV